MSKPQNFQSSPTGFSRGDNRRGGRPRQHLEVPHEVSANGGGAFVLFYPLGLAPIVFPLINVNGKCRHKELG